MRRVRQVMAAILVISTLQGCGSSGTDATPPTRESIVTSRPETVAEPPSSQTINFALNSDMTPAKSVNGIRFTFTLPGGLEPALIVNPGAPDADTVEIDPAFVTLAPVYTGAVVVASYGKTTRKVQVGLIDADGFETFGVVGAIKFAVSNTALPQPTPVLGDLLLEEVITLQGPLSKADFTLTATLAALQRDKLPL